MSSQDPAPAQPEPTATGGSRAKFRILLPIALSVAALAIFLIAFWPDSHHGKKSHARRGHASERGSSPVGGSDREELEDLGNAQVTEKGSSPVGGEGSGKAPARSKAKAGSGWWYQGGKKSSGDKGDQWWYQDGKGEAKAGAGDDAPDRDRAREAEAAKKSGPDNNWWHD
ncbi:MAG: hypothetical protein JWO30_2782 [Fibrobacteres bacterium]|nr:hypothetical protein [Fibrobacterota bacterium]